MSYWKGSGNILDRSTWTHRRGPAMGYYDLARGPRGLWLVHKRRRGLDDDVWSCADGTAAASDLRARSRTRPAT